MTASELIVEAAQKGLILTVEGESIRVRGLQAEAAASALIKELRQHKAEIIKTLKAPTSPAAGRILAVEICSKVLEAHVWLAFRDDFNPRDGQAVYYGEELAVLQGKSPEELRAIHMVKLSKLGYGSKVRQ